MSLREKITKQFNEALKSKNKTLVSTLRLVLAAIKERDIAVRTGDKREEIKDSEIIKVLRKMKKQRQDSVDLYKKGQRQELLEAEQAEINIIEHFLPEQKGETEVIEIIENIIKEHNFSSIKDMGKIMNIIKTKYTGVIDFGVAGKIAKTRLGN